MSNYTNFLAMVSQNFTNTQWKTRNLQPKFCHIALVVFQGLREKYFK